jgi:hypothetical protein
LSPAETVDRYLPRSRDDATGLAFKEHPAVMAPASTSTSPRPPSASPKAA